MATGTPFTPAPFATTTVAPRVASAMRAFSYIAPSDYRFAPTAVSSQRLVSQSLSQPSDSLAALANVIARASDWVDVLCHRAGVSFTSTVTTEGRWVKPKPDGSLALICNGRPVWEVVGLGIGPTPSQIQNVGSNIAPDIWIAGKVIHVPSTWSTTATPTYIWPIGPNGGLYAVWSYISGWPNYALTSAVALGATSIALNPPVAGGTTLPGIYAGASLTINDGGETETAAVTATPSGLTVAVSALKNAHAVPQAPDWVRVSSLPHAIEQATIHLTSVLIKTQGSRAMVMPGGVGGAPSGRAIAEAGAGYDYSQACKLLKRYETVFVAD